MGATFRFYMIWEVTRRHRQHQTLLQLWDTGFRGKWMWHFHLPSTVSKHPMTITVLRWEKEAFYAYFETKNYLMLVWEIDECSISVSLWKPVSSNEWGLNPSTTHLAALTSLSAQRTVCCGGWGRISDQSSLMPQTNDAPSDLCACTRYRAAEKRSRRKTSGWPSSSIISPCGAANRATGCASEARALCHRLKAGVCPATLPPVVHGSPRVRNKDCI